MSCCRSNVTAPLDQLVTGLGLCPKPSRLTTQHNANLLLPSRQWWCCASTLKVRASRFVPVTTKWNGSWIAQMQLTALHLDVSAFKNLMLVRSVLHVLKMKPPTFCLVYRWLVQTASQSKTTYRLRWLTQSTFYKLGEPWKRSTGVSESRWKHQLLGKVASSTIANFLQNLATSLYCKKGVFSLESANADNTVENSKKLSISHSSMACFSLWYHNHFGNDWCITKINL